MSDNGFAAGQNVQNVANPLANATQSAVIGEYGNAIAQSTMGVGNALSDQVIGQ